MVAPHIRTDLRLLRRDTAALARIILRDRATRGAGAVMAALVVVLLVAYVLAYRSAESSAVASEIARALDPSRERSYSETVTYGIAFLAAMMFFVAWLDTRSRVSFLLAAMLGFVWFDDSFQYHERVGDMLAGSEALAHVLGPDLENFGEIFAWMLAGAVFAILLAASFWRRRPGDLGILALVSLAMALLAFFAVVVDFAHTKVPMEFERLAAVIEDGGEMMAIVLIASLSLGTARRADVYFEDCCRARETTGEATAGD